MDTATISRAEARGPESPSAARRPRVKEPFTLVVFGATGDLTATKLVPALFALWRDGYFQAPFSIVGVGRREKDDAGFRAELRQAAVGQKRVGPEPGEAWDRFASRVYYHRADFTRAEGYAALDDRVRRLESEQGAPGNRLYYLATDPDHFSTVVERLAGSGLLERGANRPWARVVVEKPFGKDLASARELDGRILRFLEERQVFRIDHYLGKEMVQNVVSFRFGNGVFEPLFDRRYVDHVQITMAEAGGMEGRRGAYYDHAGALRDVVENHLLQVLAIIAMEPPSSLGADEVRDEKVKVLRSLAPLAGPAVDRWVVRGQYGPGLADGWPARAYREEEAVARDSATETFVAMRLEVDTWRWAGVPFFLRAGKRMARRVTEVAITFKRPPLRLFTTLPRGGDLCDRDCHCQVTCECSVSRAEPGVLVFRIQPEEGIHLSFSAKRPGMMLELEPARMEFLYGKAFAEALPEAYERLLLDALRGDQTLFLRSDEVLAAWDFITPIIEAWERQPPPRFPNYAPGSWGPVEAAALVEGCQREWRNP
jgi:glucose-6-phosphate 1-dehydrogenase